MTADRRSARVQIGGLAAAFVGLGLSGALPPAVLPVLGRELGISPEQASLVLSALFAGLFLGVAVTAAIGEALGPAQAVAGGALVQAAGLMLLAGAAAPRAAVTGGLVLGAGFGATELSAFSAARRAEIDTGRLLSQLTAGLAVTSAVTPLVLGLLASAGYWRAALFAAAAVHAGTALAVLLAAPGHAPRSEAAAWRAALRPGRSHLVVFVYVGAEVLISAWAARLAAAALDLDAAAAAAATAGFWASLAAGRVLAGHQLRSRATAQRLLRLALGAAALSLALAAALSGFPRLLVLVLGLVCAGPAYGLIVATTAGAGDRRVLGGLIATGALGGAVVTSAGAAAFVAADLEGVLLLAAGAMGAAVLAARRPSPHAAAERTMLRGGSR